MITLAILCMSVFSLQAGIRIGIKAGVNLAKPAFSTDAIKTDNFTGFQVGPVIEFSGLTGFGVDAAILYSQQGLKIKDLSLEERASTLDIPVNLKMKFSLADIAGCYLSAGPYVSFRLDDQTNIAQVKTDWSSKEFGAGLNFGAGFELLKHLQVGVNYQLGLNEDYKVISSIGNAGGIINAKTRIWSITAAYFF